MVDMNKYPYTDFHELNLDWVIEKINELNTKVLNFVGLNAVKYADPIQWNIAREYQTNTVVVDPLTGDAYISTNPVPSNVLLSDSNYWTVIFNYQNSIQNLEGQIQQEATLRNVEDTKLLDNINDLMSEDIERTDISSKDYVIGDYIIWKNLLYKVTSDISTGDDLSTDLNLERVFVGTKFEDIDRKIAEGERKKYLFVGDSYAAGQNSQDQTTIEGFYSKAASFMHLDESQYYIIARGGHGFTSNGVAQNKFLADVQGEIPNLGNLDDYTDVIVCAGWNDHQATQDVIESDIEAFVNYCNVTFPNAKISIGFISYGFYAQYIPQLLKVQCAYSRCGVYNARYIGNIEYVMHNVDYMHEDLYHPNSDGQTAIANALVNWLQEGNINVVYPVANQSIEIDPADTLNYGSMYQMLKNDTVVLFPSNVSINFGSPVTATSKIIGKVDRKYFNGITGYTSVPIKGYIYGSIGTASVVQFSGNLDINDGNLNVIWNYPVVNGQLVTNFSITSVQFSIDTHNLLANMS